MQSATRRNLLQRLTDAQLKALHYETVSGGPNGQQSVPSPWWKCARDDQLPPEALWIDKLIWLVLAGRGWGKTRSGAEWVRSIVVELPGSRGAFVAKDPGEARDVMIEGPSGIVACSSPFDRPIYKPSLKRVVWRDGTQAQIFSSEEYEELRGPQHHWAWCDELPKWRNAEKTWEQVQFGLRLGQRPRACITSTPRPIKVLKEIMRDPLTVVTRGTTYDNLNNLSPLYRSIISKYEGTRLGRQELDAQILDDIPGALWTYSIVDKHRLYALPVGVDLARVVVAIDPSVSEDGNEAGIVAAGKGTDGRGYVLTDATMQGRPEAWAKKAVDTWRALKGDRIIGEANNGGQMIEATLNAYDRTVPVKLVHASRGKVTRAEPIALLYERGMISHVGSFPELEDEMCTYQEQDMRGAQASPNRMDALVWALTELFSKGVTNLDGAFIGMPLKSSSDFPS